MDTLTKINKITTELNGQVVTAESKLSNLQLECYALVVFFYKLNKEYPIFDLYYALTAIDKDSKIQILIDKAVSYESN